MSVITIGNRNGKEYTSLDGTVWIHVDGEPLFGWPLDWSADRVADKAVEKGVDRAAALHIVRGFLAGYAAKVSTNRAAETTKAAAQKAEADRRTADAKAKAERERTLRARRACEHREQTSTTVGYTGSSPGTDGDQAAAGGVTHIDTCRCGAVRYTDANGAHSNVGHWLVES